MGLYNSVTSQIFLLGDLLPTALDWTPMVLMDKEFGSQEQIEGLKY